MNIERIEIASVPVDCVDMATAIAVVDRMIVENRKGTVFGVNPEKVMRAREDLTLLSSLRHAALLIPDGIGVVFAARLLASQHIERVTGADLMPALCELAAKKEYGVFMFGAAPEVNERAATLLMSKFPGLNIVGYQHGYLEDSDMPDLVARINSSAADILFVALGSPKQELWMERYLPDLNVKVCQGVGGTFDVIAGRAKRAPLIFQRNHLEWFYRLLQQPTRIVRQLNLLRFAILVFKSKLVGN